MHLIFQRSDSFIAHCRGEEWVDFGDDLEEELTLTLTLTLSHQIVNVKTVVVHHFWPIGLARNLIEIFTFIPQATPCSIRLLAIHIHSISLRFYTLQTTTTIKSSIPLTMHFIFQRQR